MRKLQAKLERAIASALTYIRGIGSYERLRPQHRKGSAAELDVPHGLVYGEELPARRDEP